MEFKNYRSSVAILSWTGTQMNDVSQRFSTCGPWTTSGPQPGGPQASPNIYLILMKNMQN